MEKKTDYNKKIKKFDFFLSIANNFLSCEKREFRIWERKALKEVSWHNR